MLLSKKKLDKIKKIKNQTQKKYKRKKKKKRRYRKRARSFRKKKKQLNLKNKSLKVKNIRKKKYKGGGMENPVTFNLFFLTESHIKWIEVTCPKAEFRNVIQPDYSTNSLFNENTIEEIDNLSKSVPSESKSDNFSITLPKNGDPIIQLILKENQQINLQGDNKIIITQLVYKHNKTSILNILKNENNTENDRNQETNEAFNKIVLDYTIGATDTSASAADTECALESARAAFDEYSQFSIQKRQELILRLVDRLKEESNSIIELLILETGKTKEVASYDFGMLLNALPFFIEEVKRNYGETIPDYSDEHINIISHQPVGVVAGLLTWNFPLLNLAYKLGPALATGCTAVFKASHHTPLSSLKVAEVIDSVGFPEGTVNILTGDPKLISDTIAGSKFPRLLTTIGSTFAGKKLIEKSF